jgi:hypothetical protein
MSPPFRVGSKISQGLSRTNALAYFVRNIIDNEIFFKAGKALHGQAP